MPLISISLAAARSDDTLAKRVQGVSAVTAEALDVPIARIGVHLFELEANRVARGGTLAAEANP